MRLKNVFATRWGIIGVGLYAGSNWNVINLIAGSWPQVEWIIYILVGLSAIYTLFSCKKNCN